MLANYLSSEFLRYTAFPPNKRARFHQISQKPSMGGHGIICAERPLWKEQRRQIIDWLKRMGMAKFGHTRTVLEGRIRTGVEDFLKAIHDESAKRYEMNPMRALHHSMGNIVNDLVFGITYAKHDVIWIYLQELQEEGVKQQNSS